MTGFNLLSNFNPNPECIGRNVRRRYVPPQISLSLEADSSSESSESSYTSAPPSPTVMATKTLREFSAPSSTSFPGLNDAPVDAFELKTGLVNMVQAHQFCGKASEDANAHLRNFLEVSCTIDPNGSTMDAIRLRLTDMDTPGPIMFSSDKAVQGPPLTSRPRAQWAGRPCLGGQVRNDETRKYQVVSR
jgi:hypothetical protein